MAGNSSISGLSSYYITATQSGIPAEVQGSEDIRLDDTWFGPGSIQQGGACTIRVLAHQNENWCPAECSRYILLRALFVYLPESLKSLFDLTRSE